MTRTLLRLIWRLYPRRWRERFETEARADLGRIKPRPGLLLDALLTLPRAWLAEIAARRDRPGDASDGAGPGADLRGAWRSVRRSPGRAALVVVILGLALGANGAVFSVSWAVLLRTLPYEAPERIVRVQPAPIGTRGSGDWFPTTEFTSLPGVEAAGLYIPDGGANLVEGDGSSRLAVTQVDPGFFPVLGVGALVGRLIGPDAPASPEAVLSHALWVEAFGADPGVPGRSLDLSGHRLTVVGVAPPDVDLPAGTDVWVSMPVIMDFYGSAFGPSMIFRVRSTAAISGLVEARREMLVEDWADVPDHYSRPEVVITPIRDELVGPLRTPLLALAGAAAAVLLLGCLNLAGIEVARVHRRAGELGVRRALGAGTARIFRHLALELVLLAAAAGCVSLLVAWAAGRMLASWLPAGIPGLEHAGMTTPVLLFTALATAAAALGVGLMPALRGARTATSPGGERTTAGSPGRTRLHHGLVVAQVTVAVVLAVGAGLLGRSLADLRAVPLGYDTESVLTFRVRLPSHAYPETEAQQVYAERVEARLAALPGVEAVGHATRLPLASGIGTGLGLQAGHPGEGGRTLSATLVEASDAFFDAMGIELVAGAPPTPPLVPGEDVGGIVIDRTMARELFGEVSAVGQPIAIVGRRGYPGVVAGVAEDVRLQGHAGPRQNVVYTSTEGGWLQSISFAVRTGGRPADLTGPVRGILAEVDPTVPPYEIRTTGQAVAEELAARRALTALSGLFGAAGLVLVALGLYGMVAQGVAMRRRELGIRLALGAGVSRLVGETVGRALGLVVAGVVVGVAAALGVTRLLRSLLVGVATEDGTVLAGVVALVLVVGLLTVLVPASRVGRIDPVESLRAE